MLQRVLRERHLRKARSVTPIPARRPRADPQAQRALKSSAIDFRPRRGTTSGVPRLSLVLIFALGCAPSLDVAGYPLYPTDAGVRPRESLARLFGPIALVDGRNVSGLGDAYELLPGCHGVWTRGQPVDSTNYVAVSGSRSTGGRYFVLRMKPGYSYIVKNVTEGDMSLSRLRIVVKTEEIDPKGESSRDIYPSHEEDLEACEKERTLSVDP